jgi:hypothetical protein
MRDGRASHSDFQTALATFSGTGSFLVSLFVLTGLVNSAFLVEWNLQTSGFDCLWAGLGCEAGIVSDDAGGSEPL